MLKSAHESLWVLEPLLLCLLEGKIAAMGCCIAAMGRCRCFLGRNGRDGGGRCGYGSVARMRMGRRQCPS